MRKRIWILVFSLFMVICLNACNKDVQKADMDNDFSKNPRSEEGVLEDYKQKNTITHSYANILGTDYSVSHFEISKRRTDESSFSDTVYVNAAWYDADNNVKVSNSVVMKYGLYNEGWVLDEIEEESTDVQLLRGKVCSQEEITTLLFDMGFMPSDVVINNAQEDLDNRIQSYNVSFSATHRYMTEHLVTEMTFRFDPFTGWDAVPTLQVLDKKEEWHVEGVYSLRTCDRDRPADYENRLIEILSFDDSLHCMESTEWSSKEIYDVSDTSLEDFILENAWDADEDYLFYKGFDAMLRNADWDDIQFVDGEGIYGAKVFIGKDHIYYWLSRNENEDLDYTNRKFYYRFVYELEPREGYVSRGVISNNFESLCSWNTYCAEKAISQCYVDSRKTSSNGFIISPEEASRIALQGSVLAEEFDCSIFIYVIDDYEKLYDSGNIYAYMEDQYNRELYGYKLVNPEIDFKGIFIVFDFREIFQDIWMSTFGMSAEERSRIEDSFNNNLRKGIHDLMYFDLQAIEQILDFQRVFSDLEGADTVFHARETDRKSSSDTDGTVLVDNNEVNDTEETATLASVGVTYKGVLSSKTDKDYFRIPANGQTWLYCVFDKDKTSAIDRVGWKLTTTTASMGKPVFYAAVAPNYKFMHPVYGIWDIENKDGYFYICIEPEESEYDNEELMRVISETEYSITFSYTDH